MPDEPTQICDPLVSCQINQTDTGQVMAVVSLHDTDSKVYEVIFTDPLYFNGVASIIDDYRQWFMRADVLGYDKVREEIDNTDPFNVDESIDRLLGES